LTPPSDEEVRSAVEAINLSIEGLPEDVHVSVHVCQGNYAVGLQYDGQIGHRYFDAGRYKADLICHIDSNSYLIEHDRTDAFDGVLGNKQLGVGAVDVQAP
jgi:5-methyltetrahydropteroyltriglutamate--homocysteine methyltransferase